MSERILKINVIAKTRSKVESVEEGPEGSYVVRVRTQPVDGKANERICELLAEHFNVPCSKIKIVSGLKGKKKIFQISITEY